MGKAIELKAGDPCPNCGGTMVVDEAQRPDILKERHARNSHQPAQAARFAARVDEKAEEFGIIHKCERCGYRARYKLPPAQAERRLNPDDPRSMQGRI